MSIHNWINATNNDFNSHVEKILRSFLPEIPLSEIQRRCEWKLRPDRSKTLEIDGEPVFTIYPVEWVQTEDVDNREVRVSIVQKMIRHSTQNLQTPK